MKTNLELCIDLKTMLQNDVLMKPGKNYPGILRREIPSEEFDFDDNRYSFTETIRSTASKRNPHVFDGQYITVTRRDDGSLRLNFKELKMGAGFKVERLALGVFNEICVAVEGLVER
jgi:hypothetical protein